MQSAAIKLQKTNNTIDWWSIEVTDDIETSFGNANLVDLTTGIESELNLRVEWRTGVENMTPPVAPTYSSETNLRKNWLEFVEYEEKSENLLNTSGKVSIF